MKITFKEQLGKELSLRRVRPWLTCFSIRLLVCCRTEVLRRIAINDACCELSFWILWGDINWQWLSSWGTQHPFLALFLFGLCRIWDYCGFIVANTFENSCWLCIVLVIKITLLMNRIGGSAHEIAVRRYRFVMRINGLQLNLLCSSLFLRIWHNTSS
jgi:hypothetical protein